MNNIPTFDQYADLLEKVTRLTAELAEERDRSAKLIEALRHTTMFSQCMVTRQMAIIAIKEYESTRD